MSKLLDKLKEAGDQRKGPEQQSEDNKEVLSQRSVFEESFLPGGNVVVMDRNVWYLSMAFVTFMGLVALVLSFKAFVRIQQGNRNVIQLGRVLIKQDKQMEALSASLTEMRAQSEERLQSMRDQLAGADKRQPLQEDPRIKDVLKEIDVFSTELNDLKVTHRSIMSKLIDLNKEVNVLRKAQHYPKMDEGR